MSGIPAAILAQALMRIQPQNRPELCSFPPTRDCAVGIMGVGLVGHRRHSTLMVGHGPSATRAAVKGSGVALSFRLRAVVDTVPRGVRRPLSTRGLVNLITPVYGQQARQLTFR